MPKTATKPEKSPIPKKMRAMERLWLAGVRSRETLQGLSVLDMAQIEGVSNDDVLIMLEIQKRSRDASLVDYLCEE